MRPLDGQESTTVKFCNGSLALDSFNEQFCQGSKAAHLLGRILIQQSTHSKLPLIIEILGWLMMLAALFLLLLDRTRLKRWLMTKLKQLSRLAGLFALVFGAFLICAFRQKACRSGPNGNAACTLE